MRCTIFLSSWVLFAAACGDDGSSSAEADTGSTGASSSAGSTTASPTTGGPTSGPGSDSSGQSSSGNPDASTSGTTTGGETSGGASSTGGDSTDGDSSSGDTSSTGEPCDQLSCDGACIDPSSDPDFCGATACEGDDAGEVCSGSASCEAGECVESCENCSFEDGDFTGWTVVDPIPEPFNSGVFMDGVLPVGVDPFGFGPVSVTHGSWAAYNPFLTPTPGTLEFGQDLSLREGATTLEFDYRVAWDLLNFGDGTMDRPFEVHIEPAGGGEPLETVLIHTAVVGMVGDSGASTGSVDLSAYAGQTVFVNFVWSAPEGNTGPGQAELDNIRVLAD